MRQVYEKLIFLVGNIDILEQMSKVKSLTVFSDEVMFFLEDYSKALMSDEEAKQYPDIMAYAFWIRRASINQLSIEYKQDISRIGWGVVFHIAPSNIPVQFAVSLTYALLAGNASVVRVSNKMFPQVEILCRAMVQVLESHDEIIKYICIIRYNHDDMVTQALTNICDVRMIWGGDKTIETIRKTITNPRCIDIGFADRYSIAIIDSDSYLDMDYSQVANDFYNDTYFFDQNACSSPRIVIWIGHRIEKAMEVFWKELNKVVERKYNMEPIAASDKLLRTAVCAIKHPGVRELKSNNLIVRVELPKLYTDIMEYKGTCGYFFEYTAGGIDEIVPILRKECQTVSYVGNIHDLIVKTIIHNGVKGVDRIVQIGHGGDISLIWDGFDLPYTLSRKVGNN